MNTAIILVGVAGAGKTTVLNAIKGQNGIKILQPSTTRQKRAGETDEYHFTNKTSWNQADFAWRIEARDNYYGLRKSELASLTPGVIGVTLFYPGQMDVLESYRSTCGDQLITTGLDTIATHAELKQRINNLPERDEGEMAFLKQREVVCNCDCVLRGGIQIIVSAIQSLLRCLASKGVLDGKSIGNLINAGSLLTNTVLDNIQPASYDLRLGEKIWCKGNEIDLRPNEIFRIPPYSYAVVHARERAQLPKFVIAHYDLKVSLFYHGVILSNGPQIDPGYSGVLACMLFNGSDSDVPIKGDEHFATIEFLMTTFVTEGYKGPHQNQNELLELMQVHARAGRGGNIIERIAALETKLSEYRTTFLIPLGLQIFAAIIAIITIGPWATEKIEALNNAEKKAFETTTNLQHLIDRASVIQTNESVKAESAPIGTNTPSR